MAVEVIHQEAMVVTLIGINMEADIQIGDMVETGLIKVEIIQEEGLH
ncbi:Uncharacterised protein [Mycobacteroides abscessus subsp. abscessus]|nr:Uncharacterised protein [Mycobacteroides abscessus subsp. abscessus]